MQDVTPQPTLFSGNEWQLPNQQFPGVFLSPAYSKRQTHSESHVRITFKTLANHEGAANALRSYARKQSVRNPDGTYTTNPDVVIESDETHVLMHVYLEKTP